MIPAALIIETVCATHGVTPKEFNTVAAPKSNVHYCQQIVITSLLTHTRMSIHQVAELLGYKLQRIYTAKVSISNCVYGGTLHNKVRESEYNIKSK
jgi:hypothetical protein